MLREPTYVKCYPYLVRLANGAELWSTESTTGYEFFPTIEVTNAKVAIIIGNHGIGHAQAYSIIRGNESAAPAGLGRTQITQYAEDRCKEKGRSTEAREDHNITPN